MPRKPSFIHPVRALRSAVGMSQEVFATALGCAAISVKRVENGSLKLSDDLADAMSLRTGADPASLFDPWGSPRHLDGSPYTPEHYRAHSAKLPSGHSPEPIDRETIAKAAFHLKTAQGLAMKRGRLLVFQYRFQQWLDDTLEQMEMTKEFAGALRETLGNHVGARPLFVRSTGGALYRAGTSTVTAAHVKRRRTSE